MRSLNPLLLTLAVSLVLVPRFAAAQTVATSFEDLRHRVKRGQTVVVTDSSGQRTRARVGDISASSLRLLVPDDDGLAGVLGIGPTTVVTMSEADVLEVRRTKSRKAMARIGAGAGAGVAALSRIDARQSSRATSVMLAFGAAAVIGVGVDRMVYKGGTLLYRAPGR